MTDSTNPYLTAFFFFFFNNNTTNKECELMVDMAIEMADQMLEKLYGAKKEE